MLAGNLCVARRREPSLALTTTEGWFFLFLFFSLNPSDSVKASKVFSAFCLGLKRIDFQAWNACQGQFIWLSFLCLACTVLIKLVIRVYLQSFLIVQ